MIADHVRGGFAVDFGVVELRVLGCAVVAPDGHVRDRAAEAEEAKLKEETAKAAEAEAAKKAEADAELEAKAAAVEAAHKENA